MDDREIVTLYLQRREDAIRFGKLGRRVEPLDNGTFCGRY